MVANEPGARPPPFHHPSSSLIPNPTLTLPVDNLNYHYPQYQENNYAVATSHSTVVSTSTSEDLRPSNPFPALNSNENPVSSMAHGGATSFFPGASGFQTGDLHVTVNTSKQGTSDKLVDGTSSWFHPTVDVRY